jgi:hypothetical protein
MTAFSKTVIGKQVFSRISALEVTRGGFAFADLRDSEPNLSQPSVATDEVAIGARVGAASYVEDTGTVLAPAAAGNLVGSPNDLTTAAWNDNITTATRLLVDNGYTRLTDNSGAVSQQVVQIVAGVSGETYLCEWRVRRDAVPAATRVVWLRADSRPSRGAISQRWILKLDTMTGDYALVPQFDSIGEPIPDPDLVSVTEFSRGADIEWVVRMRVVPPTGTRFMLIGVLPAAAQTLTPDVSAPSVTGSADVQFLRILKGANVNADERFVDVYPKFAFEAAYKGSPAGYIFDRSKTITPYIAGARGAGTDAEGLNELFRYVAERSHARVDIGGVYDVGDSAITIGQASGQSASTFFTGHMQLRTAYTGRDALLIRNVGTCVFGKISVRNVGGSDITQRTGLNAIRINGGSGRAKFAMLEFSGFQHGGVVLESDSAGNNNSIDLGLVKGIYAGSGSRNDASWRCNFTSVGVSGTTDSVTQRSIVEVDFLYPAAIDAENSPKCLRTALWTYLITAVDRTVTPNRLTIYPRLHSSETSGSLAASYEVGAGVLVTGNNSNLVKLDIDMTDCGRGLYMGSLFGASIGRQHYAWNGTAILVGRDQSGRSKGTAAVQTYFESGTQQDGGGTNGTDLQLLSPAVAIDLGDVQGADYTKWRDTSMRRLASDKFRGVSAFRGVQWQANGERMAWRNTQSPRYDNSAQTIQLRNNPAVTYLGDTLEFDIEAVTASLEAIVGTQSAEITVIGTGTAGAPTQLRFNRPSGATINGSATDLVMTGFTRAPRLVLVCSDPVAKVYQVMQVN